MKNLTFLMPCRIESDDRLRNIITSISYLTHHFPESKIIVKENDNKSVFREKALPYIEKHFNMKLENLTHIFEYDEDIFFHKTKILNDLLLESKTEVVYNYDVDHILPVSSYRTAYNMITQQGFDSVYCYGVGVYQFHVDYSEDLLNSFMASNFDLNVLTNYCRLGTSVMGWGQMIRRQSEINSYMWNENFMSWGAEDCEFLYRIQVLGLKVGRVNDYGYHLEHSRTFNSHYHNPKWGENDHLWNTIRKCDKNKIIECYENQDYVKNRRKQSNAGV